METIKLAKEIRKSALKMVHRASASHIGSALSITDIVAVLYGRIMDIDIEDENYCDRDRFVLSKGHACVAVYACLAEVGVIPKESLETYGDDFSWLMNHISHKVEGVEFSTGALGHGLSFSVGKALYGKMHNKKWHNYVVLSDGEMDEGSNWEALMFAAHHNLDNLTAIIDCNNLQSLTTVEETLNIEPLMDKLIAFGCDVIEINGHDHEEIINALKSKHNSKPKVIISRSIKGKGVSFMENSVDWHYISPDKAQLEMAIKEIDNQ